MSPRRLLAVASVLLFAAAVHFLFLRPSRRRGRLEAVAQSQVRLACCTNGARLPVCRERLTDLLELSAGSDRVARDARVFRATCPASNELDPERAHPPEQILCGFTAAQEARENAAATLAKGSGLRSLLVGSCSPDGVRAAVPALAQEFDAACGASACLDFFLEGSDAAARSVVHAHAQQVLAALLGRLAPEGHGLAAEAPPPAPRAAVQKLLGWVAGTDALGAALALLVLGGPGDPAAFQLLVRDRPGQELLGLFATIAASKSRGAARRSALLQFALGQRELGPAEEALAIDELDCTLLPAIWPELRLEEAPRADAAARTPLRCPSQALGLLADPLQVAMTPRLVSGNWRLLEGRSVASLRFEPAARRLLHALFLQPAPPPAAVRLAKDIFLRQDELTLAMKPLLRSASSPVRAAAAAALSGTREPIPREAALSCAREQRAWLECSLAGSTSCGLVCGGAPLDGLERARISQASGLQLPDPALASNKD